MTKFFLTTTAAMLSIAASPVFARDARPAPAAETGQPSERVRAETPSVRYCVKEEFTGSRIVRKTCKTREAWLKEDFDPLAKQ